MYQMVQRIRLVSVSPVGGAETNPPATGHALRLRSAQGERRPHSLSCITRLVGGDDIGCLTTETGFELMPFMATPKDKTPAPLLARITVRSDIFGGKPLVRDMRISVELVLSLLAQGVTPAAILEDYPDLEADDIRACIAYAHAVIAKDTLSAVLVAKPR